MPTTTSGGASNAWEPEPEAAPAAAETGDEVHSAWGGAEPELTQDETPSGTPKDTSAAADYEAMKAAELRDEAKARGLPASGSKADLAGRLAEHDEAAAGEGTEPKQEQEQEQP